MGSVGDAYDNALCESFFATLECERLDRKRFQTQAEAIQQLKPDSDAKAIQKQAKRQARFDLRGLNLS